MLKYDQDENLRCDLDIKISTSSSTLPTTSTQSNATTSTVPPQSEVKGQDDKEEKYPNDDLTAGAAPEILDDQPLLSYADYAKTHKQIEIRNTTLYETVANAALLQVVEDAESFQHVFNRLFCKGNRENLIFAVHAEAARIVLLEQHQLKILSSIWQAYVLYEAEKSNPNAPQLSSNDNEIDLHLSTMSRLLELHIIVFFPRGVRKNYGINYGEHITLVQLAENRYSYLTNSPHIAEVPTTIQILPFDVEKYAKPKIAAKEQQDPHKFGFFQPKKDPDDKSIEFKDITGVIKDFLFSFLSKKDLYRTWYINREWHTLSARALSRSLFPQPATSTLPQLPEIVSITPPSNHESRDHLKKVAEINPTLYRHIAAFRLNCQKALQQNSTSDDAKDEKNLPPAPVTKKSIPTEPEQDRYRVIQWIITGELQKLKDFLVKTLTFNCDYVDDCFLSPLAWARLFDHGAMVALLQTRGALFLPASLPISPLEYAKISIDALKGFASHPPIFVETIVAAIKNDLSDKDYNELLSVAIIRGISCNLPLARSINLLLWHTSEEKHGDLIIEEKRVDRQPDDTLNTLLSEALKVAKALDEFNHHSIAIVKELFAHPNFSSDPQHSQALLTQCADLGSEALLVRFFEKYPDFELSLNESAQSSLIFEAGYSFHLGGLLYLLKRYAQRNIHLRPDRQLMEHLVTRSPLTNSYSSDECSRYFEGTELMQYLIEQGVFLQHPSLILTVVKIRRYDILAWLLADGRYADLLDQVDDAGNTPLHLAMSHWPTVQVLLQVHTININVINNQGQTALHMLGWYSFFKHSLLRIFDALLAKGADLTIKDDNQKTSLHQITPFYEDLLFCRVISYINANTFLIDSVPLLHHAITQRLPQTLSMLVQDEKVDINLTYANMTPLYHVCNRRLQSDDDLTFIKQLLKRSDLDLNKVRKSGKTALNAALFLSKSSLVHLLVTHPRMDFAKEKPDLLYTLLLKQRDKEQFRPIIRTLLRQTLFIPIPPQEITHFLSDLQSIPPTLQMLVHYFDIELLILALIHPKTNIKFLQNKKNLTTLCTLITVEDPFLLSSAIKALQCRVLLADAVQALTEDDFNEFNRCLMQARSQDSHQVDEYLQQIIDSQSPNHPFHGAHRFTDEQLSQLLRAPAASQADCYHYQHLLWMGQQFELGFYVKQNLLVAEGFYRQALEFVKDSDDCDSKDVAKAQQAPQHCLAKQRDKSEVSVVTSLESKGDKPDANPLLPPREKYTVLLNFKVYIDAVANKVNMFNDRKLVRGEAYLEILALLERVADRADSAAWQEEMTKLIDKHLAAEKKVSNKWYRLSASASNSTFVGILQGLKLNIENLLPQYRQDRATFKAHVAVVTPIVEALQPKKSATSSNPPRFSLTARPSSAVEDDDMDGDIRDDLTHSNRGGARLSQV